MSDTDTVLDDEADEADTTTTETFDPDADPVELYHHQRHRNGDETAVLVTSFGDGFQVLAFDVDAGGQLLEVEEIGDTDDEQKATGMAEYWLEQHPNGVWGGESDSGGFSLSNLFGGDGA
jgi:hypothetical protein